MLIFNSHKKKEEAINKGNHKKQGNMKKSLLRREGLLLSRAKQGSLTIFWTRSKTKNS